MSQARGGLLTVGCPLCRRVTCIGRGLSLQEALWVNSRLWEQIPEGEEAEDEEDGLKQEAEEERMDAQQQTSFQAEWYVQTHKDILDVGSYLQTLCNNIKYYCTRV